MAMSTESITAVDDERAYLLLSEPRFEIAGRGYELLSDVELRARRVAPTAGVANEDIISEGIYIQRNVAKLVELTKAGKSFELVNRTDAKLIFTIIDHFLRAQARLITKRLGGLQPYMIDDFTALTNLANMMLDIVTISDRVDLMNAPKEAEEVYQSVFDLLLGDKADENLTKHARYVGGEEEVEDGYVSPFTQILRNHKFVNRVNRFTL